MCVSIIGIVLACSWPVDLRPNQVGIEYIAHACFRLHSPVGTVILIDPWASRVWLGYDLPESVLTDAVDAVVITHPHFDHDAGEFIGRDVTWPPGAKVIRDPGRRTIGDVEVTGFRGKHAGPYGKEFGQKNTVFLFEIAGLRIVHLGDNEMLNDAQIRTLGRVDVLMITVDAREHLLEDHEVEAMRRAIKPRVLIPMHYRHPNLEPGDGPKDLGPIDPWLAKQTGVERLEGHTALFSAESLPDKQRIVVFRHAPFVRRPEAP